MSTQKQKDIERVNVDTACQNAMAGGKLTDNGGEREISEAEFYRKLNAKLERTERPNMNALVSNGGRCTERRVG